MSDDLAEGATNARPLGDTIAGTGPGIPDDTRPPGRELPEMPDDAEVERIARRLGAPAPGGSAQAERPAE